MNIDVLLLKESFANYDNKNCFANYESKAKEYQKKYKKIKDNQKHPNVNQSEIPLSQLVNDDSTPCREKLKDEIKKWFFSLPIESRIKVATVECEWVCNMLYQMYLYTTQDTSMIFKPKERFIPRSRQRDGDGCSNDVPTIRATNTLIENGCKNSFTFNANLTLPPNEIIYPPNKPGVNSIKLSKKSKNQTVTQTVVYSQDNNSGSYFIKDSLSEFFDFKSNKTYGRDTLSRSQDHILDDIKFFSVHHRYHPDCMTLKPTFLLNETTFDNYFKMSGNKNYFQYLIEPEYEENTKLYSYLLPSWMNTNMYYPFANYVFAFFEQTILIKFLLNYNLNGKKNKQNQDIIHSLLDESKLSEFFQNRKNVILYLTNNFNAVTRSEIFDKKINIRDLYSLVTKDNNIMSDLERWRKPMCYKNFSNFSNTIKNNLSRDLNAGQIKEKIEELFLKNGNITFIDLLIYQNVYELWKIESFVKQSIFDKFVSLDSDQNASDLFELVETEKGKKEKKKKKNKNNNVDNTSNNTTNTNSFITNYKKIDPEYEIYVPYFVSTCHNDGYQMCRKMNAANNQKNKVINEPQIIKQFIKKEILGDIINKVLLKPIDEPDKPVNFFNDFKSADEKELNQLLNDDEDIEAGLLSQGSKKENINKKDEIEEKQEKKENKLELMLGNDLNKKKNKIIFQTKTKESDDSLGTITISTETTSTNTIVNSNINNNISNNVNSNTTKSKKEKKKKEQKCFLYETVKKKKPKKSENNKNNVKPKKIFPYITPQNKSLPLSFFEKLHNDIITYDNNITQILSLSQNIKEFCISFIENIICESFPQKDEYSLDIYGSFATGLMIEASDIDIKIRINKEKKEDLEKLFFILANNLKEKNKFESIVPISTASVPVIKLVVNPENFILGMENLEKDLKNLKNSEIYKNFKFNYEEIDKIKIDITFILSNTEKNSNISSVNFAKTKIEQFPEVKLILRVLKRFFYTKKMNSAFNGGLSSYNLFLLVLSFAQYKRFQNSSNNNYTKNLNLGLFFYELVDFFGNFYDFRNYKIDVNSPL